MNRFAKIMQVIGWFGAALLVVAWAQGFAVRDDSPQLARHSMIALAAACLCVLARLWTIAYLALAAGGRARRWKDEIDAAGTARIRSRAVVASLLALAGLGASFALAGAILLRRVSPLSHASAGFIAIALQLVALVLERRALFADRSAMTAMASMAAMEKPADGAR